MWTEKIIGPPGTGKTTALIDRVKKELADGVEPQFIGFYSFSRMATKVALDRVLAAFPTYTRADFDHFRTIHSECFRLLHLNREAVVSNTHKREFCKTFGYRISEQQITEGDEEFPEILLKEDGDWLFFFYNWKKSLLLDMTEAYRIFWGLNHDKVPAFWSEPFIMNFAERYDDFKKQKGLWDFSDMAWETCEKRLRPGLQVLFKDEAQDSSPLLYKVLDVFLENVQRHYLAGDPDQAIYVWQGARPELFNSRPYDELTYLRQSWRIPRKVHSLATKILNPPDYRPRPAPGSVEQVSLETFCDDIQLYPGQKYIMVRHLYQMPDLCSTLYKYGIWFDNLRGPSPSKGNDAVRFMVALKYLRGGHFEVADFWRLIEHIPAKNNFRRGFKKEIESLAKERPNMVFTRQDIGMDVSDAFKQHPLSFVPMKAEKQAYYIRMSREHGEDFFKQRPDVLLGTIHAFKGAECEWAIILSDMTKKAWETSQKAETHYDEARVWYTGVTRAKEGCVLVPAEGYYSWPWPGELDG